MTMYFDNQIAVTKDLQSRITPSLAKDFLFAGNARFVANRMFRRNYREQVKDTASGQYPYATVLSCIDSRMPVETIFDQGVGDLFSARIAGNFVNKDILGSIEFACKLAGSQLIVVMGHTSCGAVKGACDGAELGNLTQMLEKIQPAVDATETNEGEERNASNIDFVNRVSAKNVELTIERIKAESEVLREMLDNGEIEIMPAMYHTDTGVVEWL